MSAAFGSRSEIVFGVNMIQIPRWAMGAMRADGHICGQVDRRSMQYLEAASLFCHKYTYLILTCYIIIDSIYLGQKLAI